MIAKFKQNLIKNRRGGKRLVAVGVPFLVAGLLMASGFNWTSPSVGADVNSQTSPA